MSVNSVTQEETASVLLVTSYCRVATRVREEGPNRYRLLPYMTNFGDWVKSSYLTGPKGEVWLSSVDWLLSCKVAELSEAFREANARITLLALAYLSVHRYTRMVCAWSAAILATR